MLDGQLVRFRFLLGLGTLLLPLSANAGPSRFDDASSHPLFRLVESERAPSRFIARVLSSGVVRGIPRPPPLGEPSALDCVHAKHDIRLDPQTGVMSAVLDLKIRAHGGRLAAVGLLVDEGLTLGAVSADGRSVSVADEVYAPARVIQITLSPALAAGDSTVVHVLYQGTLACGSDPDSGSILCAKGQEFSYFAHQSVIPYIYDPQAPQDATLDAMTRDIVLRVPSQIDVVATGEKVSETTEGDTKASTWTIDRPLSRALGLYVLAGKLGMTKVPGRSVPTTLVFPSPEMPVDKRLVQWSTPVLDFVEKFAGAPLPFQRSLTLVRLPATVGDPGTATFGMTLLSDTYASAGDLMHEETWAHENAHLFWGIIVPEVSMLDGRMMSEGLATLTEIDYTWARHFASADRDTYLARRFVPIALDLRTQGKDLPPITLGAGEPPPDYQTWQYTLWAYYKTSATLDHLRVTLGDDVFAKGLAAYVQKCSYVGCRPDDFRSVLEQSSGKDMQPFFERWVTTSARPKVSIGFAPVQGGADVELAKADDAPMTLELWLRLDDGQLVKRKIDLGGRSTRVHLDTGAWVRSVSASPRHDVMVDAVSSLEGDLDFDGETDGFDLLKCTTLVGKRYKNTSVGLWNFDEQFDPRCDVNGDLEIDDEDITAIAESFGTLRPR